jgi:hypothetical protein
MNDPRNGQPYTHRQVLQMRENVGGFWKKTALFIGPLLCLLGGQYAWLFTGFAVILTFIIMLVMGALPFGFGRTFYRVPLYVQMAIALFGMALVPQANNVGSPLGFMVWLCWVAFVMMWVGSSSTLEREDRAAHAPVDSRIRE